MSDLQETLEWIDNCGDGMLHAGTKRLAAAYREKCAEFEKFDRMKRDYDRVLSTMNMRTETAENWYKKYSRLLEVAKRMHQDLYESTIPFYIAQRVQETRKQFEELIK